MNVNALGAYLFFVSKLKRQKPSRAFSGLLGIIGDYCKRGVTRFLETLKNVTQVCYMQKPYLNYLFLLFYIKM